MRRNRFRAVLAIAAITLHALATPAGAAIVIDGTYKTGSKVPPGGATGSYTITAAVQSSAGFDPSSSDKLVVVVGSRRDRGATHWINGATYGGVPLIEAVQQRSGNTVEETTGIYYLDSPSVLADLVVSLNAKAWADDSGVAMLGLSGTLPGVAAWSGAIGTSTTLNVPVNDAIVIAGCENLTNTGTPVPQSPLVSLASNHLGSGYQFASAPGLVTPTFSGTGATTVAAAFAPAVLAGIEVGATAGDWEVLRAVNPEPSFLEVDKRANSMDPFDIEITVAGGQQIIEALETVLNDAGFDWADYHFQLGSGLGPDFVPSQPGDGLGFLSASSAAFPGLLLSEDELSFDGGIVPMLGTADFDLTIGLPGDDPYVFTLRQFPTGATTVPEPSTFALAALGLLGLGWFGRRRRRRP